MNLSGLLLFFTLCTFPLLSHAEQSTYWDFKGEMPAPFEASGFIRAEILENGLHLEASPNGSALMTRNTIEFPIEAITFLAHAPSGPVEAIFFWHPPGTPEGEFIKLPFLIQKSDRPHLHSLALTNYDQWDPKTDAIGLALPKGGNVILDGMEFGHWPWYEKIGQAFVSFWTFDEYRPYSINFLWGPLLSYNPVARSQLYATLPPFAHSATQLMYLLLIVAFIVVVGAWLFKPHLLKVTSGILFALFLGLWLLFDLRMGSEILSYAAHDIKTYVTQPLEEKRLRTHETIFAIFDQSKPFLEKEKRYGLITQENAFYAPLRYMSYPTLPITPEKNTEDLTLWLVAYRPDASVDTAGRLTLNGVPITKSGNIVKLFSDASFLFQVNP